MNSRNRLVRSSEDWLSLLKRQPKGGNKKMNIIIRKLDKTYGGYDYVEIDNENKCFKEGQTRAHKGFWDNNALTIDVRTNKDLRYVIDQLLGKAYDHVID